MHVAPRPSARREVSAVDEATPARRPGKRASAFRTIGEVAEALDVPAHVLRFWETKFPQLKPLKRGGGRRYYRPEDVSLLRRIRRCLYQEGYTIKGVQRLLNEGSADAERASATPDLVDAETLFPLEPLPPASVKPARPQIRLPVAMRTALEELRRDLLEIRELAERLHRDQG